MRYVEVTVSMKVVEREIDLDRSNFFEVFAQFFLKK